jgi:hypothetical protein
VPRRAFESLAFPPSENGSGGGCSTYISGLKVRPHDCARLAVPNHRLQLTGAAGPSSAWALIPDGDPGNVEFDSAGESPAAEARFVSQQNPFS